MDVVSATESVSDSDFVVLLEVPLAQLLLLEPPPDRVLLWLSEFLMVPVTEAPFVLATELLNEFATDATTLVLKGEINERTRLDDIAAKVPVSAPLVIDTYDIRRINSVGVREWVNFLRILEQVPTVTLVRCSPAVVAQLNSVYNFRAGATVKSVAAPFFCQQCDAEQLEVIPIPKTVRSPADRPSPLPGRES